MSLIRIKNSTMNTKNNNILIVAILVFLGVMSRIINNEAHFWLNFSMIGAISLFAGAVIKNRYYAFLVPLLSYLLSDIYLEFVYGTGFYDLSQYFTYGAMILVVILGSKMGKIKPLKVLGYSIGSTLIFWVVSNFGVWFGNLFSHLEPGLTLGATYLRAIPFLQGNPFGTELFLGSLVSDVFFSAILFGAYALFTRNSMAVKTA